MHAAVPFACLAADPSASPSFFPLQRPSVGVELPIPLSDFSVSSFSFV
jgi:hypothetical protein